MKKSQGVYNYLDCSTVHISPEDESFLSKAAEPKDTESSLIVNRIHPFEEGYWLHVPPDEDTFTQESEQWPKSVLAILRKAKKLKCYWVKLDRDGTVHHDLPEYEW